MNKPELKFRHYIGPRMEGKWAMTWHEDREISPGVPDLHYMMGTMEEYRVGWLELKALDTNITRSSRIKVEPSQHQYFRRWRQLMPIHFLIRIRETVCVVESGYHATLPAIDDNNGLFLISIKDGIFHQSEIGEKLPLLLKRFTRIQR